MSIKRILLLCVLSHAIYAQSNTDEMLGAQKARDYIQLWPDFNQKTFFYSIDVDKNLKRHKSLNRRVVIGVPKRDGEVAITMRFFNPLRYSVKTTDTLLADPSWASIGKFAVALTDLINQLPNAPDVSTTGAAGNAPKANDVVTDKVRAEIEKAGSSAILTAGSFLTLAVSGENNETVTAIVAPADIKSTNALTVDNAEGWTTAINGIRSEHLAEWKYMSVQGRAACIDPSSYVLSQLKKIDDRFFNTWYRNRIKMGLVRLSSKESIQELVIENNQFTKLLDSLNKETTDNKALLKSFDDLISGDLQKELIKKAYDPNSSAGEICSNFAAYSQIVFKRFVRACSDNQTRRDRMLELAKKLNEELKKTIETADEDGSDHENWVNSNDRLRNSFIVGRYNILEDRMRDVTVVLRKRVFNLDTDPPSIGETDEKIVGKIRLRIAQTLIPEFSTGIYYTNLAYPVYGVHVLTQATADELNKQNPQKQYSAGQTIVDSPDNQKYPVVLAGMLNLTLNALEGLAHPVIQLGVGTGKNRPTLLAGIGLRLKWVNPVIVSVGTVWAWKKELTKLAEGGVITGSTELEKDLTYQLDPKPKLYIGLQVHF